MKLSLILGALYILAGNPTFSAQAGKAEKSLDWNQFRGPNRDGLSPDTGLLQQWPASGPPQLWKATGIGTGYSSVCVFGNHLYTMGEFSGKCFLLALNSADGKILWKTEIGNGGNPGNRGEGPRSTPATDGALVFALSQSGDLVCAQAPTGRVVWKKAMSSLGGKDPMGGWGWSESPLLDGNFVVVSPGGSTHVAALMKNGTPAWQAKLKGTCNYTSLSVADIGGVRQYLYLNNEIVAGIAAKTGQVAWSVDRKGSTAIASTPTYKDGIVVVSSGYGVGHNGIRVSGAGGKFQAQEIYSGKELESHHGGFVVVGDHIYGTNQGSLVCMDLKSGKVAWQDRCVGKGSAVFADGHIIVRGEDGGIALVEANPTSFKEAGRFNLAKTGGEKAWANPVVSGGHLYIREWDNLYCYDLKGK